MQIEIAKLEILGFLEVVYQEEARRLEIKSPEPLNISTFLRNTPEQVILTGKIEGKIELICSCCLEIFLYPMKTRLNLRIQKKEINNGILDLSEEIRQQVILNLPFKPLCQEKCKGLCSRCGENLNLKKCNCLNKELDPRLEKLKSFTQEKKYA